MSSHAETRFPSRAREIFQAASELPAGERVDYVERACNGDGPLRAEVESLLESFERSGEFLEGSLIDAAGAYWIGRRVGDYEILRLIGRGGVFDPVAAINTLRPP